jgi:hypothetical protein
MKWNRQQNSLQGQWKQLALQAIKLLVLEKICRNRILHHIVFVEVQKSYVFITVHVPIVLKPGSLNLLVVSFTLWLLYPQGKFPVPNWLRGLVGLWAGLDPSEERKSPVPADNGNPELSAGVISIVPSPAHVKYRARSSWKQRQAAPDFTGGGGGCYEMEIDFCCSFVHILAVIAIINLCTSRNTLSLCNTLSLFVTHNKGHSRILIFWSSP